MRSINRPRGFMTFVLFFLIVFGLLGVYLGYGWYMQRYYITLYDGNMTRYLDIPPFSERITSANDELRGECVLSIGASSNQAIEFLGAVSSKYGFIFIKNEKGAEIEIHKNYVVKCTIDKNMLKMNWKPKLSEKLKKKYKSLFPNEKSKKKKAK